jgi:hypothetical protein
MSVSRRRLRFGGLAVWLSAVLRCFRAAQPRTQPGQRRAMGYETGQRGDCQLSTLMAPVLHTARELVVVVQVTDCELATAVQGVQIWPVPKWPYLQVQTCVEAVVPTLPPAHTPPRRQNTHNQTGQPLSATSEGPRVGGSCSCRLCVCR